MPDAVLAFDDSIEEKPHTDENEIVCWHYDHSKGRTVKGINFLTAHYVTQEVSLPVSFELVEKTERYCPFSRPAGGGELIFRTGSATVGTNRLHRSVAILTSIMDSLYKHTRYTDKKGRERRRSATTKNERFRNMVAACVKNQLPIRYVLADSWYAAADNMRFFKLDLKLDFIFALNRTAKSRYQPMKNKLGRTPNSVNDHHQRWWLLANAPGRCALAELG